MDVKSGFEDKKTKNKKNKKNNKNKSAVIITVIGILLIAAGLFMLLKTGVIYKIAEKYKPISVTTDFSSDVNRSKIKIYSGQSLAVETSAVSANNLKSAENSYNTEGGVYYLYDGDPETRTGSSDSWATLDAGSLKALSYISYIPNTTSQEMANTCVGTKFLASKDNKTFVELGTVTPDVNGDLTLDRHLIELSGYGEYRYFKVELSSYASFGEIEWVCDDGITMSADGSKSDGKYKTEFKFTAFDAAEDFSGKVLLAVYNSGKTLKAVKTVDCDFTVGGYTDIVFSDLDIEVGDYIRVIAYDGATMEQAAESPLDYRFTEGSAKLGMSNIYSDNMMFQADEDLIISGVAPCGSVVEAELKNTDTGEAYRGRGIAENVSDWEINFGAFENGGNYTLTVTDGVDELEFENITFGDVWIFAGQSNMDFYVCGEESGEEFLKSSEGKKLSENPEIRLINMYSIGITGATGEVEDIPLNDWNGYWAELTPDRASYLSAIAFYFSIGLNERYDRNVGIISVAVGDTEINQWYPRGEQNGSFTGDSGKLYNNRIYPFTKLKIKGIIWYQGEADLYRTGMNAEQYSDAMSGLINTYRDKWNESDLPFYYVQLARYGEKDESEIREGQRLALQKVRSQKNLGFISLLDIIGTYEQGTGSARSDIHPWQKRVVAERYLDYVGHDLYGDTERATSGPVYRGKEIVGNTIVLSFEHTGSLRVMDMSRYADSVCEQRISETMTDTGVLHEFWITDENGKLYPANAEIVDDKVVVSSDDVENPCDVLYAWGAYPEMPNLTDDTDLPAFTFNTANGSEFE